LIKGVHIHVWSAVDADSKELLAIEASYCRSSLNALKMCTNQPLVLVDKGPWYRWALETTYNLFTIYYQAVRARGGENAYLDTTLAALESFINT
jgi:transposase-like protein